MTYICPYCKHVMVQTRRIDLRRMTRDHIYPLQWGGTDKAENIRMCCQSCNALRGAVGHCIGAMACVQHIAKVTRQQTGFVARLWRMYAIASLIQSPVRNGNATKTI